MAARILVLSRFTTRPSEHDRTVRGHGLAVITDGEQRKYHNFATYCVEGLPNTAPDGFKLPFADGHARRWPRLTGAHFAL